MKAVGWLIPPLVLLAGRVVWTRLPAAAGEDADRLEDAFATLLCGVFLAGMLGLLLAELGALRREIFAACLAGTSAALLCLPRQRSPSPRPVPGRDTWAACLVCVFAVATVAPASEDLLGGRDPGVYANIGSWLAREGTLRIHADALTTVPADTRHLFYAADDRRPYRKVFLLGFFVAGDGSTGEVTPQFLHLLPVYLAIGHWLGGSGAAFLVAPLFGVLAELAVFFFVRRMLGLGPAVIAACLLALNLAQIWVARNPYSEGATQLGVFAMLWCIVRAFDTGSLRWGSLGGVSLGICLLLRIDALLLLPALVPGLVVLHASAPAPQRWLTHAFLPLAVILAMWGTLHGWLFSRTYILDLRALLPALWGLTVIALMLSIPALVARRRVGLLLDRVHGHGRGVWTVAALVLTAAFVFGIWIRPGLEPFGLLDTTGTRSYNEETLVRVAWYVSMPGMLLGLAGVVLLLYRSLVRRRVEWIPFLTVLLAFSFLYFWRQMAFPDHPWAMRRYLPVIVPGICLGIAAAAEGLWTIGGRLRGLTRVVAAIGVATVGWHEVAMARPFWDFKEKAGALGAVERIARLIPKDAIVLFTQPGPDVRVATPLALYLGRSVLPVVRPSVPQALERQGEEFERQIARWMHDGTNVFYLTSEDGDSVYLTPDTRWEPMGRVRLRIPTFGANESDAPRAPELLAEDYHVLRAAGLQGAAQPCAPASIRADALLLGRSQGLFALDSHRRVRFRWVAPDTRLLFQNCDRRQGRPQILRVRATCGPRPSTFDCRVQVAANGVAAGTIWLTRDWGIHDLQIPPEAVAAPTGAIELRFQGPRFVPEGARTGRDWRALSFQLASVALVPAADAGGSVRSVAARPRHLNLISAAAQDIWGVSAYGFYDEERANNQTFRWTDRHARVVVPLEGRTPRAVRLSVSRTLRPERPMRISANGCSLFEGVLPRTEWSVVLPLDACSVTGDELTVAIESEAMRPSNDSRELGVAVRSVQIE